MNVLRKKKIINYISHILNVANIKSLPIDVEKIAKHFDIGVKIKKYAGNDELSGVLVRDEKQTVIGVNANHSSSRQRFTIAHELGHFFLHEGEQLFIDKNTYHVNFRDSKASTGTNIKEIEANNFASMLLMPTEFLLKDLKNESVDIFDDEFIKKLADKYKVSQQAMTLRLANM